MRVFVAGQFQWKRARRKSGITPLTVQAQNITIPSSISVGDSVLGSYTFFHSANLSESNEPPKADGIWVTGTTIEGGTIGVKWDNLVIPNGGTEGNHVYKWYRSATKQPISEILLQSGTSKNYTLQFADATNYIRVDGYPVQSTGANRTGTVVRSVYSSYVTGTTFNPASDINWITAFMHTTLPTFSATSVWVNSKGSSSSASQDGVRALPVYNPSMQALEFTRASSQNLVYQKGSPGITAPYEYYVRLRVKSLPGNMQILGPNSSVFSFINSNGAISLSGSFTPNGIISTNTWYVVRILTNGASSKIELNFSGTEYSVTGSTVAFGTTTGRIASSFSGTNFFDGFISDIFVIDTPLTLTERNNMKTWFGL